MTPPLRSSTATKAPAPGSPQESPEVQAARYAVDQAGYARNGAEITYKQAVADHGADSAEAKSAKSILEEAQAKVEKSQADLSKALKVVSQPKPALANVAPKPASNQNTGSTSKPAPQKPNSKDQPKNSESVEKIFIELPRGEVIQFRSEFREIILKEPKIRKDLEKLLEEIKKNPQKNGGYLRMLEIHSESSRTFQVPEARPLAPRAKDEI